VPSPWLGFDHNELGGLSHRAVGDATAANHMTMFLRQEGVERALTMDMVIVREARGIGMFLLTSHEPIDTTLRDRLLRAIADRLAKHTAR